MAASFDFRNYYRADLQKKVVYLDIKLDYYRELYNEWDFSPLQTRDLDDDLCDYLEECAQEIPQRYTIEVQFHLPQQIYNPTKERKSIEGYRNYISYRIRKTVLQHRLQRREALYYAFGGGALLILSMIFEHWTTIPVVTHLLEEGFIIGSWVLFWEFFSIIIFKQILNRKKLQQLKKLLSSTISYTYISS